MPFPFSPVPDEITASFRRFGPLIVDWPHKAESKSYFPPKGKIPEKQSDEHFRIIFLSKTPFWTRIFREKKLNLWDCSKLAKFRMWLCSSYSLKEFFLNFLFLLYFVFPLSPCCCTCNNSSLKALNAFHSSWEGFTPFMNHQSTFGLEMRAENTLNLFPSCVAA